MGKYNQEGVIMTWEDILRKEEINKFRMNTSMLNILKKQEEYI